MSVAVRLAVIGLFALALQATSSLAQVPGYVRIKLVKAGVVMGAGGIAAATTHSGFPVSAWVSQLEHPSAVWKGGLQVYVR
jgi:hypothetical protein